MAFCNQTAYFHLSHIFHVAIAATRHAYQIQWLARFLVFPNLQLLVVREPFLTSVCVHLFLQVLSWRGQQYTLAKEMP